MRRVTSLVLCLVFACMLVTPALAGDPDFWGIDSAQPPIGPQDEWVPTDDGNWSDGWHVWGDLEIILHWVFGRKY